MTEQRELDRLLGDFFVDGTNEISDRVIVAALDQIDHTRQRRAVRVPWRFPTMAMPFRLAAAALIGVLAIGGAFYLTRSSQPSVGPPAPSPTATAIQSVAASPTSGWTTTGSPAQDRGNSSVTVALQDHRVLLAGGDDAGGTAELYDPAHGSWTRAGDPVVARSYATATLLADGKVLLAGGANGPNPGTRLLTAELFDPATDTWTATGSMTEARTQAFAAMLRDGRVLVAGGNEDNTRPTAELYDPVKGSWTATGNMMVWRAGPLSATVMTDGRVLVAGGFTTPENTAEIFDPTTGTWTATGSMDRGRADNQSAVLLNDGRVLIVGGSPTSAQMYDPATRAWTATRTMLETYNDLVVLNVMPDGTVLSVGGGGSHGGPLATAERFDPTTGTWSDLGPLAQTKFVRSASPLGDGRVLVVGSATTAPGGQAGAEIYQP